MIEQDFIKAYARGWYDHGRQNGTYLWDVQFEEMDFKKQEFMFDIARNVFKQSVDNLKKKQ